MDEIGDYLSFLGLNKKKGSEDDKPKPPYPGTLAPLRRKLRTDEYMSKVEVEDHIVPIWERETEVSVEKEPLEDLTLSYSYSLLSFVSRSITEGTVSSYESDEFELLSESEIEENEVRGVYLHELQHISNTDFPKPDAYPVFIKGMDAIEQIHTGLSINGNTVECVDASPYSQQFPVILYEWFVGMEYNSLERYSPEPLSNGKTFKIPLNSIGKYIFCRAHRLVEAQLASNNMFPNAGTYDPHTFVFQNAYPNQKKFHNISTLCSSGPVDISNDLALKLLENLTGDWTTKCTMCYNKDLSSSVTYEKANLLKQTLDVTLHITPNLCIKFSNEDRNKHVAFHNENLSVKIKEWKESEESEPEMSLELVLDETEVSFLDQETQITSTQIRESNHCDTEFLVGIYEENKLKYYFSLKFEDRIQCIIALYTIRCHIAQKNTGLDPGVWNEKLQQGDLAFVVTLVREYLCSI